jgi:putative membrane protein
MGTLGRLVAHLIVNALAIWLVAQVVAGIHFNGDLIALVVVALIFAVVNTLIKPVVNLLTLPLTVLTLGLFALIVNALMLLLTGALAPSFSVDGFIPALIGVRSSGRHSTA